MALRGQVKCDIASAATYVENAVTNLTGIFQANDGGLRQTDVPRRLASVHLLE